MLKDILTSDLVVLDAEGFKTPEEVIRFAGGLLEKAGREEVVPTLEALERVLGERARAGGDVRRLLRGTELVAQLRQAARLNVGGGQLAGWLCAGMFPERGRKADPAFPPM